MRGSAGLGDLADKKKTKETKKIEKPLHTAVKRGARAQFPQNFRLTKS